MKGTVRCLLIVVLMITAGAGCGHRLPLVPVTGVVVIGTKPVAGAEVSFLSEAPGERPAVGRTDAAGRFDLKTYWPASKKELVGASPGLYRVVISQLSWPNLIEKPPGESRVLKPPVPTNNLPERYSKASTSGLSAEVRQGEVNDFTFTLE